MSRGSLMALPPWTASLYTDNRLIAAPSRLHFIIMCTHVLSVEYKTQMCTCSRFVYAFFIIHTYLCISRGGRFCLFVCFFFCDKLKIQKKKSFGSERMLLNSSRVHPITHTTRTRQHSDSNVKIAFSRFNYYIIYIYTYVFSNLIIYTLDLRALSVSVEINKIVTRTIIF